MRRSRGCNGSIARLPRPTLALSPGKHGRRKSLAEKRRRNGEEGMQETTYLRISQVPNHQQEPDTNWLLTMMVSDQYNKSEMSEWTNWCWQVAFENNTKIPSDRWRHHKESLYNSNSTPIRQPIRTRLERMQWIWVCIVDHHNKSFRVLCRLI